MEDGPESTGPEDVARQTAADHLSIPVSRVDVVESSPQEFADASLGCPEPGFSYAQVITPGHRVTVEADGRRFDIRVAGTVGRICQAKALAGQASKDGQFIDASKLVPLARQDLAGRLGLPTDQVGLTGVSTIRVSTETACEQIDSRDEGELALRVGLKAEGREYTYHVSGDGDANPCPDILPR